MPPSFPLLTVTYDISHFLVVPTDRNQLIVSPLGLCLPLLPCEFEPHLKYGRDNLKASTVIRLNAPLFFHHPQLASFRPVSLDRGSRHLLPSS